MKNYRQRKMFVYILVCAMFGSLVFGNFAQAVSKCRLNRKSLTLKPKESYTLRVYQTKKKVKWKSSNRKIASVISKGKAIGKIKAKKVGKCKIYAQIGKKRLICKVNIKKKETLDTTNKKAQGSTSKALTTKKPVVTPIKEPSKELPTVVPTRVPSEEGSTNEPMVTTTPEPTNEPMVTTMPEPTNEPMVTTTPEPTNEPMVTSTPGPTNGAENSGNDNPETPDVNKYSGLYNEDMNLIKSWEDLVADEDVDVFTENGETIIGNYACKMKGILYVPQTVSGIAEYAFYQSDTLRGIVLSDGVTDIGKRAFEKCSVLEKIEFGCSLETIGENAFAACAHLKKIIFTGDKLAEIKEGTFSECTSLESIAIPLGVTYIGISAFDGCISLREITISERVMCIDAFAFADCSGVDTINVPNNVEEIGELAFLNVPHIDYHGVIEDEAEETGMWGAISMN